MRIKQKIQQLKRKIHGLRANHRIQEVVGGTRIAFFIKVIGAGLVFALNIAVARLLGAEGTGIYFLSLAVVTISSVVGRVGLDNALIRFVAAHAVHGDWAVVKSVHVLAMRCCLVAAGAVTTLVFILAPWLAGSVLGKSDLAEPLRWMSLSILPMAILFLEGQSLQGLKRISDSLLLQGVWVPCIVLLMIYPMVSVAGVEGVTSAYSCATAAVALLGWWRWRSVVHSLGEHERVTFDFRVLWNSAKYLYVVALINRAAIPWLPLVFLGAWVSSEETGIFGAATRVALLVSFMLSAINSVVAPIYAELHSKGELDSLGKTARFTAYMTALLAAPIFLPLLFFGDWVMSFFGPEFESGGKILAVLAFGQFVNSAVGPAANLLNMSGYESANSAITITACVLMLTLSVLLVPLYGAMGAAVATTAGVILHNILSVVEVRRKLGIRLLWI